LQERFQVLIQVAALRVLERRTLTVKLLAVGIALLDRHVSMELQLHALQERLQGQTQSAALDALGRRTPGVEQVDVMIALQDLRA
jgi:hypothetical protein